MRRVRIFGAVIFFGLFFSSTFAFDIPPLPDGDIPTFCEFFELGECHPENGHEIYDFAKKAFLDFTILHDVPFALNEGAIERYGGITVYRETPFAFTPTLARSLADIVMEDGEGAEEHARVVLDVYRIREVLHEVYYYDYWEEMWIVDGANRYEASFVAGGYVDEGPLEMVFEEEGEYMAVAHVVYPDGYAPPAYTCGGGGDFCFVPSFNLSHNRERIASEFLYTEAEGEYFDIVPKTPANAFLVIEREGFGFPHYFGAIPFSVLIEDVPEEVGYSNVLFLPGIKGSRLYRMEVCGDMPCEKMSWVPNGSDDVRSLFLNEEGKSVRDDIFVKEGGVLNRAGNRNYYNSFTEQMNNLRETGQINDWHAIAYDWRLSLPDIVQYGHYEDGRISYTGETDTPYLESTLRELASTSKTGKVTIVAHSNGGLLGKYFLHTLGEEANELVDNFVLVGVPQLGAPQAVGALLYGHKERLPENFPEPLVIISSALSRELAEYMPSAYHLLPSRAYFDAVPDTFNPVVSFLFGGEAYKKEREAYGDIVFSWEELRDFLLARDKGRAKPSATNVREANILHEALLTYAQEIHSVLNAWAPPPAIRTYQIAGWGDTETISGFELREMRSTSQATGPILATLKTRSFRPVFTEDGDGVVPIPSALALPDADEHVERLWINLREHNVITDKRDHADLFEIPELRALVENILSGDAELPRYFYREQPPPTVGVRQLRFFLYSPLTLTLTGENGDEEVVYGEFGEVKYASAPAGENYTLTLEGYDEGEFALEIEEVSGGTVTYSALISGVPSFPGTLATLSISGDSEGIGVLVVDVNGDGETDLELSFIQGENVLYEEPSKEEGADDVRETPVIGFLSLQSPVFPGAREETFAHEEASERLRKEALETRESAVEETEETVVPPRQESAVAVNTPEKSKMNGEQKNDSRLAAVSASPATGLLTSTYGFLKSVVGRIVQWALGIFK